MPRVKEFTVSASHTFNLGNYESTRVEASVTIEKEDDKDFMPIDYQMAQDELFWLLEHTMCNQPHSKLKQLLTDLYVKRATEKMEQQDESTTDSYPSS